MHFIAKETPPDPKKEGAAIQDSNKVGVIKNVAKADSKTQGMSVSITCIIIIHV